jgi:tetratricopeptide (TPR) repeat protein
MSAKLSPLGLAAAFAALAAGSAVVSGAQAGEAARSDATRLAAAETAPMPAGDVSSGAGASAAALDMRPRHEVDESALRYYASQKDRARVDAETRRLRALYPDWTPPEDLWSVAEQGPADEAPLWELFSADRIDELQAIIAERKRVDPSWTPSRDLDVKLRRKVARRTVVALWNDKKWKELVAYAQADPLVAEIGDVDILWALAEGFANAKQRAGALAILATILRTSADPDERIGTLHKAIANLPMADVETLIAMGRKGADGKNEFDVILVDIARARISAYLHEERAEPIVEGDLKAFEAYARAAKDADQPGLVAWYLYKTEDFKGALDWFKLALSKGGDSMIAHGLAHALRELGHFRETEEVAYAWRGKLINNRILFVDILERDLTREIPPYIESERLARYGRVAVEDASGEAAQGLAWYAYNSCQYDVALEWFERAMAWLPKQETVYGYALTLRKLKKDKEFLDVVNRADGLHPKVVELLFPEERYRPPTPCEVASWDEQRWWDAFAAQNPWIAQQKNDAAAENARPLPGRLGVAAIVRHGDGPYTAGYEGFVQNALHDPLGRYSWGVVTGPTGLVHPQRKPENATFHPPAFQQVALPTPEAFPLAVLPENPLRFAALPAPDAVEAARPAPALGYPLAVSAQFAPEPYRGPYPIIARRVADVGAMPYEKFGGVVLDNPEPGKPLIATPALQTTPAPRGALGRLAVSPETTGSIGKRAAVAQARPAPAPTPATMVAPLYPGAPASSGPLPVTPPPGLTWAPPPSDIAGRAAAPAAQPAAIPAGMPVGYPSQGQPGLPAAYGAAVPRAPQPVYPGQIYAAQPYAPSYGVQAGATQAYASAPYAAHPSAAQPYGVQAGAPQAALQPAPAQAAPATVQPTTVRPTRRAAAPRHRRVDAPSRSSGGSHAGACSLGASGTGADLSPRAALSTGWCLVNAKRPSEAALAFDRAMAAGGKTAEDAAYGKSIAKLQTNDPQAAARALEQGGVRGGRRQEVGVVALEQRVYKAYDAGDYHAALRLLRERSAYAAESRDLTLMRGWSHYQLGQVDEAGRLFKLLDAQMSTKQSRSGLAAVENQRTRMAY